MDNSLVLLQEAEKQIRSNNGKPMSELAITLVSAAKRALTEAETAGEVMEIHNKLASIEDYFRRHKVERVSTNLLAEQRIETEWIIGGMIPKQFPQGKHSPLTLKGEGISYFQSHRFQQIHSIDLQDLRNWFIDNREKLDTTTEAIIRFFSSIHISDDSYEWNTPTEYIEAARGVMGSIDLDPATNETAQQSIQANEFYTAEDDGLAQPWSGNVWLNPPYNMPAVEQFVDRAIYEYQNGNIKSAIILTNNSTDTGWFHRLLVYPVCFTKGRIQFWSAGGDTLATRQGQALFYLGDNPDLFAKVFSAFGVVMKRYDDQ